MGIRLLDTALDKCPDAKSDTFTTMVLDLLFSGSQQERQYAMKLFNNPVTRRSQDKAIACIYAYKYFKASGGHVWHETYDVIQKRLRSLLIVDDDRSQDLLVQTILSFLALSERPEDLIVCLKLLKNVDEESPNIKYLLFTIISLSSRFSDQLIIEKCIKLLEEIIDNKKYSNLGDDTNRIITDYLPRFLKKRITPFANETIQKIALSLSGGGFRASLFHAGLLSALEPFLNENKEKLKLDSISAVSGGSITAAYFCTGHEIGKFINLFKEKKITEKINVLSKLFLGKFSFNRFSKLEKYIEEIFFNKIKYSFKNLMISPTLNILTYDYEKGGALILSRNSLHEHLDFSLSKAISASCAFPIVLNPIKISKYKILDFKKAYSDDVLIDTKDYFVGGSERFLYDGGLVDNTGLITISQEKEKYSIVICSDCGSPVYDEKMKKIKVYNRLLSTSISEIGKFLKKEMLHEYGPYYLEVGPEDSLKNIPTFCFPSEEEAINLFDSGKKKGEDLSQKLSRMIL